MLVSRPTRRIDGRSIAVAEADRASVRAASKGSHVYADLKEAILSGRLPPGSSIDKAQLCERLGVSRFPVASALQRLAFERLVVVAPQHGSFVAPIALGEVLECMLIRSAIEAETAALAAERQPAALRETLDRSLRYQRTAAEAEDRDGFYALDVGFHAAILQSLGLTQAASVLDGLRGRLERVRRILGTPPGRALRTYADHRAIAAAIAAGDAAAAREGMRLHLNGTTTLFHDFATQNPALFSDQT